MLLKEFLRISTQHRTFYCYLALSIWIFLLIAGMYKYISQTSNSLSYTIRFLNGQLLQGNSSRMRIPVQEANSSLMQFKAICTPLVNIQRLDDGGILDGWKLLGVLLVLRHGDRGSMSHIRPIVNLDCAISDDYLVKRYRSFLYNSTSVSGSNYIHWNKAGSFHSFPLLPMSEKECQLGQLTYKYLSNLTTTNFLFQIISNKSNSTPYINLCRGIAQLLHLGEILNNIYARPLGLWIKPSSINLQFGKSFVVSTPLIGHLLNSDEVVLYTTRVRRTFQSALAFLYRFLPLDKWLTLNVRESHSIAFCFSDCVCQHADDLRKLLLNLQKMQLYGRPTTGKLMQWIARNILQYANYKMPIDQHEVMDAVITIMCHDASWPCNNNRNQTHSVNNELTTKLDVVEHINDFINIDQDELNGSADEPNLNSNAVDANQRRRAAYILSSSRTSTKMGCIESVHISKIMDFITWRSEQPIHQRIYQRISLLRAYGMLRHIVSYMLRMISGDRTKFVLYSGHDWTLQYITSALGIQTNNIFIAYAARLAFEVYKSDAHSDYYFRVIYNGRDVTQQIDFCEGGQSLRVTKDSRGHKADLCPIENIIRFLHEDYFSTLNATNFKDACVSNLQN